MRFTKGKHAFLVATHTDRAISIIISFSIPLRWTASVNFVTSITLVLLFRRSATSFVWSMDCLLLRRNHTKSVSNDHLPKAALLFGADEIRQAIDRALLKKPKDFEEFLRLLEQDGYTCKRGKHTALWKEGQDRFCVFRSLEKDTQRKKSALSFGRKRTPYPQQDKQAVNQKRLNLLVDIDVQTSGERNRLSAMGYGL